MVKAPGGRAAHAAGQIRSSVQERGQSQVSKGKRKIKSRAPSGFTASHTMGAE